MNKNSGSYSHPAFSRAHVHSVRWLFTISYPTRAHGMIVKYVNGQNFSSTLALCSPQQKTIAQGFSVVFRTFHELLCIFHTPLFFSVIVSLRSAQRVSCRLVARKTELVGRARARELITTTHKSKKNTN